MSYGASIDIRDEATPLLNRIHATVSDRVRINRDIGDAVKLLCQEYVNDYRPDRHATANKLGADPTNFLEHAIKNIHFTADADAVIVDFSHPWFATVGHDVHIVPGEGKKFLAIPIAAPAYGKRLQGNFNGGKFFKGPRGGLFYGIPYPGAVNVAGKALTSKKATSTDTHNLLQPLYILLPFVDQKQDRTRLPSDEQILKTIRTALHEAVEQRIAAHATLNN